jgi:SnoaL-like domain
VLDLDRPRYGLETLLVTRDHDLLDSWLKRFGHAWESRDAERAAALFTEDGSYRESPFDQPLIGSRAISAHWASLPMAREDISFTYEILAIGEQWGVAHWHGSYTPLDGRTRLEFDGILLVSLDGEGRCRDFREWSCSIRASG